MRTFTRLVPFLLSALLFVSPVSSVPTTDCAHKVKENIDVPRGWLKVGEPPANRKISLKIALPQPNFHELERHLYEVSDPGHERYGQHLSKEEVEELVAPHPESLDTVNNWLSTFGFSDDELVRTPAQDWITITVPLHVAEEMLDTKYYVWKHIESGDHVIRTTSYSLPRNLHDHIDLVQPTTMFGRFRPEKSNIFKATPFSSDALKSDVSESGISAGNGITVDASCNQVITITCLQQLYNSVGFTPTAKENSIGITGYLEQFANMQDLQTFFAEQRPDAVNSSFKVVSVAGGLNNQSLAAAGDEADLDVEFAFGLSHPISPTFFTTAGSPPFIPDLLEPANDNENEPYTTWLDFILATPDPPKVISTSYGDNEQTVPFSFAQRACSGFAQLGARGVSVIFASGDFGVGDGDTDPATQECITNNGRNQTKFIPSFPASCPFVTSVGGTSHIPEVAVESFFSGGGFSNFFERPSYQDKDVTAYLDSLAPGTYAGLFNPKGRGIPDVSAQADLFKVIIGGEPFLIGGTSAATPTFSAFIALLNDVRLNAGKQTLGFLNPFLYSKGFAGLNDITVGNNGGCGTPGFNASKGWDPVTGLGTPNFGILKKLVLTED